MPPASLPPNGPAGGDLAGTYPNPAVAANAITSAKILDGTITATDLAPGVLPASLWTANGANIYNANTGNVGIGVTAPLAPLHVKSTNARAMFIDGPNNVYAQIGENGTPRGYYGSFAGAPEDVDFGTVSGNTTAKPHLTIQAVPKMTIDTGGNVGIGTMTPVTKLHVITTNASAGTAKFEENNTNSNVHTMEATSNGYGTAGHFVMLNPLSQNAAVVGETYGNGDAAVFLTQDTATQATTLWTAKAGKGRAAVFLVNNALNPNNAVDISMAGTGWALTALNSSTTTGQARGLLAQITAGNGGVAFEISNGQMVWSAQNGWTSNAIIDDEALIVTVPGNYILPIGRNGQQVWVVNNSTGNVLVTNIQGAALTIPAGRGSTTCS